MTRKRSLTTGLFGMPQALTEAALGELTPAQREGITAEQAGAIMRLMVNTAESVGRIMEQRPPAQVFLDNGSLPPPPLVTLRV